MTKQTQNTSIPPASSTNDDPRPVILVAMATARSVIDGIDPTDYSQPTPCAEYHVLDMLGHTLGVFGRLAAAGRGDDPMAINTEPPFAPVSDWRRTFAAAALEVEQAWRDPSTLERIIELPWATVPGAAMLAMYTNELTVHTWDLARATDQSVAWDTRVLELAFATIQAALPADGRVPGFVPFDPVVPTPDDAPLIDRLVAWNGRQP